MGNQNSALCTSGRKQKKYVHWKTAERPAPPGKPLIFPIYNNDEPNAVMLKWLLPRQDGGASIKGFRVECNRLGTTTWIPTSPPFVLQPELVLTGLEQGHQYQFRVVAANLIGISDYSEISDILTISSERCSNSPPKFTLDLADISCLENEKVEFRVEFIGIPPPTIAWYIDGNEIFSSRRTAIITEDHYSVLIFHQAQLTDEGEVKCTATNRAGYAVTKCKFTLEAPPKLRYSRQYEDGLLYEVGETVYLKISIVGKPYPTVEWTHNGQIIKNTDHIEVANTPKFSVLKINSALRTDRGEYQIHAKNSIGDDSASFLLTITAPPDPPENVTISRHVGSSVTLTWDSPVDDGGCKVGNYIIEYNRKGWNVWLKAATSRKHTVVLYDLIDGSEYRFRVKAESPYGLSPPSNETDVVKIPGKSVDQELESQIFNEILLKQHTEESIPTVSPRKKRKDRFRGDEEYNLISSQDLDSIETNPEEIVKHEIMVAVNKRSYSLDKDDNTEKRKSYQFDLEECLTPPRMSFSVPNLRTESIIPTLSALRFSASSSDILHEKAMDRAYRAIALRESLTNDHDTKNKYMKVKECNNNIPMEQETASSRANLQLKESLSLVVDIPTTRSLSFDEDYTESTASSDSDEENLVTLKEKLFTKCEEQPVEVKVVKEEFTNDRLGTLLEEECISEEDLKSLTMPESKQTPKSILKRRNSNSIESASLIEEIKDVSLYVPILEEKPKGTKPIKSKRAFSKMPKMLNFFDKSHSKENSIKEKKIEKLPPTIEAPAHIETKKVETHIDRSYETAIDYYGSIVEELGSKKKKVSTLLNTEELKNASSTHDSNKINENIVKVNNSVESAHGKNVKNGVKCVKTAPSKEKELQISNNKKVNQPVKSQKQIVTVRLSQSPQPSLEELDQQAKRNLRKVITFVIDGSLLLLSFWIYFFKDERLAIPFVFLIIYRKIQEIFSSVPDWMKQITPPIFNKSEK